MKYKKVVSGSWPQGELKVMPQALKRWYQDTSKTLEEKRIEEYKKMIEEWEKEYNG